MFPSCALCYCADNWILDICYIKLRDKLAGQRFHLCAIKYVRVQTGLSQETILPTKISPKFPLPILHWWRADSSKARAASSQHRTLGCDSLSFHAAVTILAGACVLKCFINHYGNFIMDRHSKNWASPKWLQCCVGREEASPEFSGTLV